MTQTRFTVGQAVGICATHPRYDLSFWSEGTVSDITEQGVIVNGQAFDPVSGNARTGPGTTWISELDPALVQRSANDIESLDLVIQISGTVWSGQPLSVLRNVATALQG